VTKPARFSAVDIKRAVKAMRDVGCEIAGAKIETDGSIIVLTGKPQPANDRRNPLDRLHGS